MKRELFYQSDKSSLKNGSLFLGVCSQVHVAIDYWHQQIQISTAEHLNLRGMCVMTHTHIEERQHAVTHILFVLGQKLFGALW